MTREWKMERPARQLVDVLGPALSGKLPAEILRLDDDVAGLVVDLDGVDYMLTMTPLPKQRSRPATQ